MKKSYKKQYFYPALFIEFIRIEGMKINLNKKKGIFPRDIYELPKNCHFARSFEG